MQSGAEHTEISYGRCAPRGRVIGILGELDRAGLLHTDVRNVLGLNLRETLDQYDIMLTKDEAVKKMFRAGPAGIRTTQAFSQDCRWDTLDDDRQEGCIRTREHAFSQDGGLAVLYGNMAEDGCIVKTAGVDKEILTFKGPAKCMKAGRCGGSDSRRQSGRR